MSDAATRNLMTATSTEEVATLASETATQVLEHPMNGIHLYDAETDALVPVAWSDGTDEMLGESPPALPLDDSVAGRVYRTGHAEICSEVDQAEGSFNPDSPFRSEYVLPLGDHGVVLLSSGEPDDFGRTEETLARVLAANIEAALDRVEQRQELQQERDRLDEFSSIVSHDLRNPLTIAEGQVDLARRDCDSDHLDAARDALRRMDRIIDRTLTLARSGRVVGDTEPVDLSRVAERCWGNVSATGSDLEVEPAPTIRTDPGRLRHLFENLYRNAVEHGGDDVTVTVGRLPDRDGFYVADDGPGIPEDERDQVFEVGYSTAQDGTGLWLNITKEIATAHGWEIAVTESETGGARFEIVGVDVADE